MQKYGIVAVTVRKFPPDSPDGSVKQVARLPTYCVKFPGLPSYAIGSLDAKLLWNEGELAAGFVLLSKG